MAFITPEQTKLIKRTLKAKFPNFKFSVRTLHYSKVMVTLLSGPADFSTIPTDDRDGYYPFDPTKFSVNEYHLHQYGEFETFFKQIVDIVNHGNYDRSDVMTDYFDVGFYTSIRVGDCDKPFVNTLALEEVA